MERRGMLTTEKKIIKNLTNVIDFIGGEELASWLNPVFKSYFV